MVLETVVDYNFCFPVGCNPPVFFMFILTFMGDAFLFDVTLGDLTLTLITFFTIYCLFGTDIQANTKDKINRRL